jgi:hypothetical protein
LSYLSDEAPWGEGVCSLANPALKQVGLRSALSVRFVIDN